MKVAFTCYDRALQSGIALATDMLRSARSLQSRKLQRGAPLDFYMVGKEEQHQNDGGMLQLRPQSQCLYHDKGKFDLVFLPPMWGNPFSAIKGREDVLTWLRYQHQAEASIVATGTAVCWLAEAGLLDGEPATTHWYFYDKFARRYPQVQLNRAASLTNSGNIFCARSINSQTELMVYLVSKLYGLPIARIIEKHFMHEVSNFHSEPFFRVGGTTQYDETVAIAQSFIEKGMANPITLSDIASFAQVSNSTLIRKFREQVGMTPHKYLQQFRLDSARQLLKDLKLSIGQIACLVGIQDPHYFSKSFEAHFGLSPKAYRQLAKVKPFEAL